MLCNGIWYKLLMLQQIEIHCKVRFKYFSCNIFNDTDFWIDMRTRIYYSDATIFVLNDTIAITSFAIGSRHLA